MVSRRAVIAGFGTGLTGVLAGCSTVSEFTSESQPDPEVSPTTPSNGDGDMPSDADQTADGIRAVQQELGDAATRIETTHEDFTGVTLTEPGEFTGVTQTVTEHVTTAEDRLSDLTGNDMTAGQEQVVDALQTLTTAFTELAPVFDSINEMVTAYSDFEAQLQARNTEEIAATYTAFAESVPDQTGDFGTARDTFNTVPSDALDPLSEFSPGRIQAMLFDVEAVLTHGQAIADTTETLETGCREIITVTEEFNSTSWNDVAATLSRAASAFGTAAETATEREDSIDEEYQQDLNRVLCVSETGQEALQALQNMADAYANENTATAVNHMMDGHRIINRCSYTPVVSIITDFIDTTRTS